MVTEARSGIVWIVPWPLFILPFDFVSSLWVPSLSLLTPLQLPDLSVQRVLASFALPSAQSALLPGMTRRRRGQCGLCVCHP